jgi:hypothetical protein
MEDEQIQVFKKNFLGALSDLSKTGTSCIKKYGRVTTVLALATLFVTGSNMLGIPIEQFISIAQKISSEAKEVYGIGK